MKTKNKELKGERQRLLYMMIRAEERERQFNMLMSCLPKDAENLATLTPEQALKLITKFISLRPWS